MIAMRGFLPGIPAACFAIAALLFCTVADEVKAMDEITNATRTEELRQAREEAAHRRRRIIFNNDGNEPVYYLDEATPKALLDCRTTPLLDSHVDSIFYCTWSSGFSYFTHNTKIGQVFDTTANPDHPDNKRGGFSKNKTREFVEQGTDPLEIMVEFCKEHDIEIFWSFRMNDTHDAWGSWYGEHLFPQLKKDHPEWLVASKENRSKHGGWSAMDFNHKEVRDLAVRFIEEVCEHYDVDGIEMDFFRHPVYFRNPAWGKDASPEELDKMTDMVRKVREVTERVGLERGRPILVGVRVPDSADYCRAMGLDIVRCLEEDLIDLMAVSGYFRLSPWETSVELGHRYGVPVYPCLSESRMRDPEAKKIRASVECYRGRAANAWAAGADGVYLFTSFNPRSPLWSELGDPGPLRNLDKVYTTGARGVTAINSWMENGEKRFLNRSILSPERPRALKPGETVTIELPVAGEVDTGTAEHRIPDTKLRLRWKEAPSPGEISVGLNGQELTDGTVTDNWIEHSVDPGILRTGNNTVEVTLRSETESERTLEDLGLRVRY